MVHLALCILFLFGVAQTASAERLSPTDFIELRRQADQLFDDGQLVEAQPLYERLSAANPGDGDLQLRLARTLFETNPPAAMQLADSALADGFGNEPRMSYGIAQGMAGAGQTDAAIGWLARALATGYEDQATIKSDPAFEQLRDDPRFRALAGMLPSDDLGRDEGWAHDLDLFLAETNRLYAAPDASARMPVIEAAIAELKGAIGDLSDEEIAIGLHEVIVGLGDGHSTLLPIPGDKVPFETLPIAFAWFDDGVFVTAAAQTELVGKQVVAIGDRSLETLADDLGPYLSRDNDQGLRAVGPLLLRYPALLRAMGHADGEDPVRVTLADAKGNQQIELVPERFDAPRELMAPPGVEFAPLWLRQTDDNYWHEPLPELDALYVQFNRVRDKPEETIADYAAVLKDALRETGARNLIFDVRHNGGGNNSLVWPLVRLAVWHDGSAPDHRLYVITGPATFSAAQNFINRLEQMTNAVFVGQPSSSKPNFTGESTSVELPYSGLQLSISSRYWQDSQPGDRRPFIPVDIPVAFFSDDYFAGHDPVMEALGEILTR